jgi:hypothetical protein
MVLKLTCLVDADYYDLQKEWKNRSDGSFDTFNGRVVMGLRFSHLFKMPRGPSFPLESLFETISHQLKAERVIIISLASYTGWHMYVIYDEQEDFIALTKIGEGNSSQTAFARDISERVRRMGGTDILVYENMDTQ